MTFYGRDIPGFYSGIEKNFARYVIAPKLLEMFLETKIEMIPLSMVRFPYPLMYIETNDRVSPRFEILGIIVSEVDAPADIQSETSQGELRLGDDVSETSKKIATMWPIYKVKKDEGETGYWTPTQFTIKACGENVMDVVVDWATEAENAEDMGLHDEHPLVKRASKYCWMIAAMVAVYATTKDADVVLGMETKEYKKLIKKKRKRQAKLEQLKNTRFLGSNIKIDRKVFTGNRPSMGGTHASPIPHWRSGHFRRLSDDKVVWVRPCIIGFGKEKRIPLLKKYLVE